MKAVRFSLTFIALALWGNGHAGPCKPRSSTTISSALHGTSSTEVTISASTGILTATDTTSAPESSTTDLPSIVSVPVSSTVTATSDAQLSSSTEISTSSVTSETVAATTSSAEVSSSTEILTRSNTAETTTSDVPTTTTTTEASGPTGIFLNPSFEEPDSNGDYNGSPWYLADNFSPKPVHIDSGLGHGSSHSAYWSVTSTIQNGYISQIASMEPSQVYRLTYWWYIDQEQHLQNFDSCYISVVQQSLDGQAYSFLDLLTLDTSSPLKTWTERVIVFNSGNIVPAEMGFGVNCDSIAGSGVRVAIDDIILMKQAQ